MLREHVDPTSGWPFEVIEREGGLAGEFVLTDPRTGTTYRRITPENGTEISVPRWIELIKLGEESIKPPKDQQLRRCGRVLAMVHELHKLGFQQLRIIPYIAPSGGAWRCEITHRAHVRESHGAQPAVSEIGKPTYSSAMEASYFEWEDSNTDSARLLAKKFLERFPDFAERGRGADWEYAGWYCEMLGAAERGALPVAFADTWDQADPNHMETTMLGVTIPIPPAGGAARL